MINCQQARPWLDRLAAGATEDAPASLAAHCAACPQCSAELARIRQWKTSLRRAVAAQPIPTGLETRLRARLRQPASHSWWAQPQWQAVAAAFALLMLSAAAWLALYRPARAQLAATLGIGRHDHVHCTLERQKPPFGALQRPLPPSHAAIVPAAQRAMPPAFALAESHTCRVQGRAFTHLVFSDGSHRVSFIVTAKRQAETLPRAWLLAKMKADGIAVYQDTAEGLQTAAIETPHSLGFVVSDLGERENLRLMAAVASAIQTHAR
ncbi:MAG: hypothetical protein JNK48_35155 [Bryobacterales bacterium]|nr:hypothetical protein [Bryobacterales bacterium]